jgi:hypothetical protein
LALSVPPSRFTSRVGGGSAFYVRPKPYAIFGVQNHIMKKHIAFGLVASMLFLAGCCTSHHATTWEYRNVSTLNEVNDLAKTGWSVVTVTHPDAGPAIYLLKHPTP